MILYNDFKKCYSEKAFWKKIKEIYRKVGRQVLLKSLELFFTAKSSNTPISMKAAIYGALGYFICPIDAIPDPTPVFGYCDDLSVLGTVLTLVAKYIDNEVHKQANSQFESIHVHR